MCFRFFFFFGGGVMVVPNSQQGVDDMVRQLEMFVFFKQKILRNQNILSSVGLVSYFSKLSAPTVSAKKYSLTGIYLLTGRVAVVCGLAARCLSSNPTQNQKLEYSFLMLFGLVLRVLYPNY